MTDPLDGLVISTCPTTSCVWPHCDCLAVQPLTAVPIETITLDDPRAIGNLVEWPVVHQSNTEAVPGVAAGVLISVDENTIGVLCSVGVDPMCPPEFHGRFLRLLRSTTGLRLRPRAPALTKN